MLHLLSALLLLIQTIGGNGFSSLPTLLVPPSDAMVTSGNVQCGQQLARKIKVVNGNEAYEGEFPWMVSIRHKKGHICGGSIIASQWVLSAAHCFNDPRRRELSQYRIVIGDRNLNKMSQDAVTRGIAKIINHDRFSPSLFINDIALVKLTEPITWNRYIQPVCLATSDTVINTDPIVIGWGYNAEPSFGGHLMEILQKVTLKLVENKECAIWYQNAGYPYNVRPSHLCAGYKEGDKDSCDGDSGGPLVIKDNGRFTLIGVVSSGIGCARRLLPGLYTNVSLYHSWIQSHMNESNAPIY